SRRQFANLDVSRPVGSIMWRRRGRQKQACVINHDHMILAVGEDGGKLFKQWALCAALGQIHVTPVGVEPKKHWALNFFKYLGEVCRRAASHTTDIWAIRELRGCLPKQVGVNFNRSYLLESRCREPGSYTLVRASFN